MKDNDADTRPLIFISHDARDEAIASGFAALLDRATLGMVRSFRSSDHAGAEGIQFGAEWYAEIVANLEAASDVVCLLTPRSYHRPWIYYEAGYAKGKLGKPVHGLVLGIPMKQVTQGGPFGQFQNCPDDPLEVTRFVMQLAERVPNLKPAHDIVQPAVDAFLALVQKHLPQSPPEANRANPSLLHHVSLPVRNLEESVAFYRDVIGLPPRDRPGDLLFRIDGAWFELPNGQQQLHLLENPSGTFRASNVIDFNDCHFALRVPDVSVARKRVKAAGHHTTSNEDIEDDRYPHFYVLDPDGHVIEVNGDSIVDKTKKPAKQS
ncbi:MAG: hypothetical protein QOC81_2915 [Thermoanaerobaculia bacterium]|nr:hypothetical protein [Thermoanaerobaculia bacterium]